MTHEVAVEKEAVSQMSFCRNRKQLVLETHIKFFILFVLLTANGATSAHCCSLVNRHLRSIRCRVVVRGNNVLMEPFWFFSLLILFI